MVKYIYHKVLMSAVCVWMLLGLLSCKDDDVSIDSVWSNSKNEESVQLSSSYVGSWVALKGHGFTGLLNIYCNGSPADFNPAYVDDNYIVFQIPSKVPVYDEVEDENVRNTIQVITSHGEAVYHGFIFKDPRLRPSVKNISHTLPTSGQYIYITGSNLDKVQEIYFPGDIKVPEGDFALVNDSKSNLMVKVPQGVGNVTGQIRLSCAGDDIYTPQYVFFTNGLFITTFDKDGDEFEEFNCIQKRFNDIGVWPDETGKHSASVTDAGIMNESPSHYISMMKDKVGLMVEDDRAGWFTFNVAYCFQKVVNRGDPKVQASTLLENLAIEFDAFMEHPWKSGFINFRFSLFGRSNDDKFTYNFAPWKNGSSFDFKNSWRTMTIPLLNFPKILGDCPTLGDLIDRCKRGDQTVDNPEWSALFSFTSKNYNGDSEHTVQDIDEFQINIANLRLVPYTEEK